MRPKNMQIKTLAAVWFTFILTGCAAMSAAPSGTILPAYRNSTPVADAFHRLPPAKDPDNVPTRTVDGLSAWGQCAIDFNQLRANKGLLSEAVRNHEAEDAANAAVWEAYRKTHRAIPAPQRKIRVLAMVALALFILALSGAVIAALGIGGLLWLAFIRAYIRALTVMDIQIGVFSLSALALGGALIATGLGF